MTPNPFEFGAANDFRPEEVLDYYIEDFNYSRFIQSKRNVFVLGERGSGKTMTLLYHTLATQRRKSEQNGVPHVLDRIGIYVPCNTPLTHRTEHELLERFRAAVLSEHFLVLSIVHHLAKTLDDNGDIMGDTDTAALSDDLGAALGRDLPEGTSLFKQLLSFTAHEIRQTQHIMNQADSNSFYSQALSFSTLVIPLLEVLRKIQALSASHFLFMIDDAHDLNEHQVRVLNSWIAYRDHSFFSFKIATSKVNRPSFVTATGGSILEGHDFTIVDMEKPFQNDQSEFGRLAERIVSRRLERFGCNKEPDEFFPVHPIVKRDLEESKKKAREEALEKYPHGTKKQVSDYVYKYHRAIYFRNRSAKANRPVYSGFKMVVYLSTGIVRNLLEPCYWMYEKAVSSLESDTKKSILIDYINPSIQNDIIMMQSEKMWDRLEQGLDTVIAGCSAADADKLKCLFEGLARLFRVRLLEAGSEPRATSFSISARNSEPDIEELDRLLILARRATLLYTRAGSAKDEGSREYYYVPNRMLWPVRGLDPQGQHARVSLLASRLLAAARGQSDLETAVDEANTNQESLFDDHS